jgi:hypothetical protein
MNIIEVLLNCDWFKISQSVVGICMAMIANNALGAWKKQSKAKILTDFLNEITETVHEYILLMATSQEFVRLVNIGIEAHSLPLPGEEESIQNPNFVRYIQRNGKDMSARILEHLNKCRPIAAKISSLLAKGQVLGLEKYEKCQNSCNILLWQFNCIEALAVTIGSTTLNWHNELIQKNLTKFSKISADDLKEKMQKSSIAFLIYIKERYAAIYK